MSYLIDQILIIMRDVYVIIGMDRLSRFVLMIDYEGQQAIVQTPSRGEVIIY